VSETLTVTEVVRHFADYVSRVVYRRESFVLTRGNKPVAELRPLPSGRKLSELPGLLASLPRLGDVDSFAEDLDVARDEIAGGELADRWQS
jgi:antitoxin (DNA-binding transcriptional repressor) of toxin-antitoxin stability system